LAITEGWLLYQPDPSLAKPLDGVSTGGPQIGIDPRGGKLAVGPPKGFEDGNGTNDCEVDRLALSHLDDDLKFRVIQDDANRANTSFYPVDPRGLVVFDTPIGPAPPPSLQVDANMLRTRQMSLRTLAYATDGMAIVN